MLSFTRDTFGSHILIQCHPEELAFIKINKSTALIHGLKYPGKRFIQVIIVSASHFCCHNLEVIFQDKQSQLPFWGYQHLCCCQLWFMQPYSPQLLAARSSAVLSERFKSLSVARDWLSSKLEDEQLLISTPIQVECRSIHLGSCRRSGKGHLKDFVGRENSAALVQEIAKLLGNCGYVLLCEICCVF